MCEKWIERKMMGVRKIDWVERRQVMKGKSIEWGFVRELLDFGIGASFAMLFIIWRNLGFLLSRISYRQIIHIGLRPMGKDT